MRSVRATLLVWLAAGAVTLPVAGQEPIHRAAARGDRQSVQAQLDAGVAVDAPIRRWSGDFPAGTTPLMIAACVGDPPMISLLIEAGADVDARDSTAMTPLLYAARCGSALAIPLLVEAGADPDATGKGGVPPLALAIRHADALTVGALLNGGADPSVIVPREGPLLVIAADDGDAAMLRMLLQAGAPVDTTGRNGLTALMRAARSGDGGNATRFLRGRDRETFLEEKLSVLLEGGAAIDAIDDEGNTALVHAARGPGTTRLRVLLEAGADPDQANRAGTTPLMWVVAAPHPALERIELLAAAGADMDARDRSGQNALWLSDQYKASKTRRFEALVAAGADVNATRAGGRTLLMRYADSHDVQGVRRLLAAGARVDLVDQNGQSSLDLAVITAGRRRDKSLGAAIAVVQSLLGAEMTPSYNTIGHAVRAGLPNLLDALLVASNPIADREDQGASLLRTAVYEKDRAVKEVVRLTDRGQAISRSAHQARLADLDRSAVIWILLASGVTPDRPGPRGGMTALMSAARQPFGDELVTMLVDAGAQLEVRDQRGRTALVHAVSAGALDAAAVLLTAGADVNTSDRSGRTALMAAVERRQPDCIDRLLAAGADPDRVDDKGRTAIDLARALSEQDDRRAAILEQLESR